MATIQFEDGTKVNFEGSPTPDDIVHVEKQVYGGSQQEQPSLAEKASGLVQNAAKSTASLLTPSVNPKSTFLNAPVLPTQMGKTVLDAGVAADKRVPAENVLPLVGAGVGAAVGGAALLPSGAGLPFGATIGAGIGGQVGDTARQYISAIRGNPGVAKTPEEAVKGTALTGAGMAAAELGTAGVLKGLEAVGAKQLGKSVFNKFAGKFLESTKPVDNAVVRETIGKFANAPAADTTEAGNFIKEILDKKGIKINASNIPKPSEAQLKNFTDAGLTPQEIDQVMASANGLESSVRDIATSMKPKLSSDLQTPKLNDYKGLANVYQDLNNPNLTYGKIQQIQNTVGDQANFGSPERSGVEKVYGKIYNHLNDLLQKTADDGGFSEAHNFAKSEGQKFYQNRFLQNAINASQDSTPNGDVINYGKLATKLNDLHADGPNAVENVFGENTKYFNTLRELANQNAKLGKETVYSRITSSGRPTASIRLGNIMDKVNGPQNINKILNRNLGSEASSFSYKGLPILDRGIQTEVKRRLYTPTLDENR